MLMTQWIAKSAAPLLHSWFGCYGHSAVAMDTIHHSQLCCHVTCHPLYSLRVAWLA